MFDTIIDLDATSPLREISDIIKAYGCFNKSNYNNLVSGSEAKKNPYFNQIKINKKSVKKISDEIFELASLAKQRKLKVDQLKGATFTISSLSGIGGKFFTPIINPPEVGIMGLSKTFKSLRMENGKVTERDTLPMSLSYDHRVINGAYAAKFITALTAKLEDIEFLNSSFGD